MNWRKMKRSSLTKLWRKTKSILIRSKGRRMNSWTRSWRTVVTPKISVNGLKMLTKRARSKKSKMKSMMSSCHPKKMMRNRSKKIMNKKSKHKVQKWNKTAKKVSNSKVINRKNNQKKSPNLNLNQLRYQRTRSKYQSRTTLIDRSTLTKKNDLCPDLCHYYICRY